MHSSRDLRRIAVNPYNVLKRPLLTERSALLRENEGKYLFEVDLKSTKTDVKAAVETLFGVNVVSVATSIKRFRPRRRGMFMTKPRKMKKAFITLAEGAKLPIFEDQ